jgi:hypothetical protein
MKVKEKDEAMVRKVIADALAAGYTLSVWDGEEETLTNSSDADALFKAMMTTDQDHLYFLRDGKSVGWVFFVYGESGWDVINDYTVNLEEVLKGADALSDELADA